jgi:hypothetical protein
LAALDSAAGEHGPLALVELVLAHLGELAAGALPRRVLGVERFDLEADRVVPKDARKLVEPRLDERLDERLDHEDAVVLAATLPAGHAADRLREEGRRSALLALVELHLHLEDVGRVERGGARPVEDVLHKRARLRDAAPALRLEGLDRGERGDVERARDNGRRAHVGAVEALLARHAREEVGARLADRLVAREQLEVGDDLVPAVEDAEAALRGGRGGQERAHA